MLSNGGRLPAGFTRFSTDGLADKWRIPRWERHNADALVGLEAHTEGAAPLHATELNLALPRLQLARVTGTAHRVTRDEAQVAAHPAGGVVAYLTLHGAGSFIHRHGVETVNPGQGILIDADQPFERGFAEGLTEVAVKVPRSALTERSSVPNLPQPRLFEFAGHAADPGARLALLAGAALAGQPVAWEPLEVELVGLVADLLSADSTTTHLVAAETFIAAHFHRPELSAAGIAAAAGISERHLSRIFAASGRNVPRTILNARLGEARRLLAAPEMASAPIAEIAARCGFTFQAQFSRDYRARFGMPPSRHRHELLELR